MIINCPVCLTQVPSGSAYITSCGHIVCCLCLRRWRSYCNPLRCPVCMSREINDTQNNLRPLKLCCMINSNVSPNYRSSSLTSNSLPSSSSLCLQKLQSCTTENNHILNINELPDCHINTDDSSDYNVNIIRCVACHRCLDNEQSRVVFDNPDSSASDAGQFNCDGYSFSSSASASSLAGLYNFSAQIGHAFCVPCFQSSDIDKRRNSMFDSVFFCPGCRTKPILDCVFPMFIVNGLDNNSNNNAAINDKLAASITGVADSAYELNVRRSRNPKLLEATDSINQFPNFKNTTSATDSIEYNHQKTSSDALINSDADDRSRLDCLEIYYTRPRHALILLIRNLTCELLDCLIEMPVLDSYNNIAAPPTINY